MVKDTYQELGDRAPVPCSRDDADAVAMAVMEPGTTLTPLPFKHPPLLDDEVRMKITHSGQCHTDVFIGSCSWSDGVAFPCVPGHEMIGVVEKVGEKVSNFKEGDRVGFGTLRDCCDNCAHCRIGRDNCCNKLVTTYDPHFGGYATGFQAKAKFFFHLPENIPGEAAPLFCAGITTYAPLKRNVLPGMKVAIVGIGGLGHLGIQFANKMGCEVTAISTSPSKEEEARSFGAHHFLNSKDPEQVKNAMGSFDFLMNTSTGTDLTADAMLLKKRGIYNVVGVPERGHNFNFNLMPFLFNHIEFKPSLVGSRVELSEMLDFCCLHNIFPKTEVYPFADAQAGFDSLAHGNPHYPRYRAVLETESFFKTFTPAS